MDARRLTRAGERFLDRGDPAQEVALATARYLDKNCLARISALDEYDLSVVAADGPATVCHSLDGYPNRHPSGSSRSDSLPHREGHQEQTLHAREVVEGRAIVLGQFVIVGFDLNSEAGPERESGLVEDAQKGFSLGDRSHGPRSGGLQDQGECRTIGRPRLVKLAAHQAPPLFGGLGIIEIHGHLQTGGGGIFTGIAQLSEELWQLPEEIEIIGLQRHQDAVGSWQERDHCSTVAQRPYWCRR